MCWPALPGGKRSAAVSRRGGLVFVPRRAGRPVLVASMAKTAFSLSYVARAGLAFGSRAALLSPRELEPLSGGAGLVFVCLCACVRERVVDCHPLDWSCAFSIKTVP